MEMYSQEREPDMIAERTRQQTIDPVRLYLDQAGQTPLLTRLQEVELGERIRGGQQSRDQLDAFKRTEIILSPEELESLRLSAIDGKVAHEHMVSANLLLVVSIARKYQRKDSSMQLLDLIQEGTLGLMHAVDKFDYDKGFKFSTYASWWIRQAITRALDTHDPIIGVPENVAFDIRRLSMFEAEESSIKGRIPKDDELVCNALSIDRERLRVLREAKLLRTQLVHIDNPIEEGGRSFQDILPDAKSQEAYDLSETNTGLEHMINKMVAEGCLLVDEVAMLKSRYYDEKTYEEIGQLYDIGYQAAKLRVSKILRKIRNNLLNGKSYSTTLPDRDQINGSPRQKDLTYDSLMMNALSSIREASGG